MNTNEKNTSHRINPNNTGSLWCAQHANDWSTTTHFEYYAMDKQVHLGASIFKIFGVLLAIAVPVLITIECFMPDESKIPLLGFPVGAVLGYVDYRIRKARRRNDE